MRKIRNKQDASRGLLKNNECPDGLVALKSGNFELAWDPATERLVVSIDCSASAQRAAYASKSGKTRILSTTSGFVTVPAPGVPGLELSMTATLPIA